jgi:hypothetical protein
MACRGRHATVADEILKYGGRLNAGRSALCRETQAHTLPAGPIDPSFPLKQLHFSPNPALGFFAKTGGRLSSTAGTCGCCWRKAIWPDGCLGPCWAESLRYPCQRGRPAANHGRFRRRGRQGKEKCPRHRLGKQQFRALGFSGDAKLTPSVVRGSIQH